MKQNILIAIGLIILVVLLLDKCDSKHKDGDGVDTVRIITRTIIDTGTVVINNWLPVKVIPGIRDTVHDTTYIVGDYNTQKFYAKQGGDSVFKWDVSMSVLHNSLQDLTLKYSTTYKEKTITVQESPSRHIWLGAFAGGGQTFDYGAQIIMTDRRSRAYTINYSIPDKSVHLGIGLKIK